MNLRGNCCGCMHRNVIIVCIMLDMDMACKGHQKRPEITCDQNELLILVRIPTLVDCSWTASRAQLSLLSLCSQLARFVALARSKATEGKVQVGLGSSVARECEKCKMDCPTLEILELEPETKENIKD